VAECVEGNKRIDGEKQHEISQYPAFSPDLAYSEFFLLCHIEGKLQGSEFRETDELHMEIRFILNLTSCNVLKVVFLEWET
jgi:hypothetical protein